MSLPRFVFTHNSSTRGTILCPARSLPRFRLRSYLHSVRSIPSKPLNARFYSSNSGMPTLHNETDMLTHSPATTTLPSAPFSAPPYRSRLPRILSLTLLGLFLTTTSFLMAASPALPLFAAAPTDPSSLSLYTPDDPILEAINTHITTHPVVLSLRRSPTFTESRPHMKIPPPLRAQNLTAGPLAGLDRIAVPPLAFVEEGGRSSVVLMYLGKNLCGHPGIVHGGMLAAVLDEGLARTCFPALPSKVGMTASLKVDYQRPVPSESYVCLRAWTRKVEGRKAWVEGRIESLPGEEGEEPVVYVEAEALFIEPRHAATMAKLYPAAVGT